MRPTPNGSETRTRIAEIARYSSTFATPLLLAWSLVDRFRRLIGGLEDERHKLIEGNIRSLVRAVPWKKYSGHPSLRTPEKRFPFSHENGPYTVAKLTHALPSRRLKRDTPRGGVQRVGPARMLFVVCPIQSQPDGRHHRTK